MKSKHLALTVLALALTACNNNDETDNKVNGEPVEARFFGEINGATHRAAGTAWATGDAIGITETSGNTTYTNIKYTYAGGSNALFTAATTANTIYYQNDNEATFTAYYPFGGTEKTTPADITKTLTADMQDATNKSVDSKFTPQSQIDFLYGTGKGQRTTNDGKVEFKFEHKMSKLVLNFIEGNEVSLNDLSQYTLDGLEMAGTFNPKDGTAAASGTATTKTLTIKKEEGSFSGNVSSLILFPQTATSATLTVTVNSKTYTATLPLPTKTATGATGNGLESGKSYTYNVTVGSKEMTVSKADISDWTDGITGGNGNVDAYPGI
ncbi:fimbrillin family protein [Phocaeicola sp.]